MRRNQSKTPGVGARAATAASSLGHVVLGLLGFAVAAVVGTGGAIAITDAMHGRLIGGRVFCDSTLGKDATVDQSFTCKGYAPIECLALLRACYQASIPQNALIIDIPKPKPWTEPQSDDLLPRGGTTQNSLRAF